MWRPGCGPELPKSGPWPPMRGSFMEEMPGLRFGHAGSIVEARADTAAAKARILREAGVLVAEDLSEIPSLLAQAMPTGRQALGSGNGTAKS